MASPARLPGLNDPNTPLVNRDLGAYPPLLPLALRRRIGVKRWRQYP